MKLHLKTTVNANYEFVWQNFNQSLFERLSPPFPKAVLKKYDGNGIGDQVDIELDFIFFKNRWLSEITENEQMLDGYFFRDVGVVLPFFLGKWSHKHIIAKSGKGTEIRDEVEFEAPINALSFLLYPAILGQFLWRIPIYKKVFKSD
jgi:ligand-binding SRPBCC domain-containing protein